MLPGNDDAGVTGTEPTPDMGGPGPPQQGKQMSPPLSGPGIGCPWPGSQVVWRVLGFPLSCSLFPRLFTPDAEAAAPSPIL